MNERRYDLDWLRIGAFGLLIVYHLGMFYVPWDWHVKSSRAGPAIEPLMTLLSPWRLLLLFLISGAATGFIAQRIGGTQLAAARLRRLLPPLLLAVILIVPPQSYYEVAEAIEAGAPLSLDRFYMRYLTGSGHWCDADGCLLTPTWNHMWFVAYLAVYTIAALPLLPWLQSLPGRAPVLLAGPGLLLVPWLYLWTTRAALLPTFGVTHLLIDDWYMHAVMFPAFLLGIAIGRCEAFFRACMHWRATALVLALAAWAGLLGMAAVGRPAGLGGHVLLIGLRELQAWTAIVAALGFAHRHLSMHDSRVRRTLTVAIFPCYLVHQTIIVVAGHYLDALALPLGVELILLIAATLFGCWMFYVIGSRLGPLRIWVGLPQTQRSRRPAQPKPDTATPR